MSAKKDLTGQRFGRLVVLYEDPIRAKAGGVQWVCQCDCGNKVTVRSSCLLQGYTKSCGCLRIDIAKEHCPKPMFGDRNPAYRHGHMKTRIYSIWQGMKKRCYEAKQINFMYYGGRGVTVCDEWKNSFKAFYKWAVSNGYRNDLTLDRIDPNGHYCPGNCRWVSWSVQNKNKRAKKATE